MSFTDEQRNALRRLVDALRDALTDDLAGSLSKLGIDRDGGVKPESALSRELEDYDQRLETRRLLLRILRVGHSGCDPDEARAERVENLLRGIAFTHLHRFVAFKMMEAPERKVFKSIVGDGRMKGEVLVWLAREAPEGLSDRWDLGLPDEQDRIYRRFLDALCAKLHGELGALFDPGDLASRVFPEKWKEHLAALNHPDFKDYWDADETLGWVYQYYTPKSLRDDARKKSAAPRNPWELAFRNQFYTPDYVVRFLADNTLGRLWVEMFPETELRGTFTKLLMAAGEAPPKRAPKDPRAITVLDPACGSGHFLLYCFGLFEHIYKDAWDHPTLGAALRADYGGDRDRFRREVPRLIIEHNLHGIDIDRRAVQIASLALWLRARKGLPERDRKNPPTIERSHIVCAEPLPGDVSDYQDFRQRVAVKQPTAARILDRAREMLSLAGDLGSLLRVDRDLPRLVAEERKAAREQKKHGQQLVLLADERPLEQPWEERPEEESDEAFWTQQEDVLRALLADFGQHAEGFEGAAQRLFAKDGAGVLRFLDAVRKTHDVVLMNPPFGKPTARGKDYIEKNYPSSWQNLFASFVERAMLAAPSGFTGVISTDAGFFRRTLEPWRRNVLLARGTMDAMVHLGEQVLDATVRVAIYTMRNEPSLTNTSTYFRLLGKTNRIARFDRAVDAVKRSEANEDVSRLLQSEFKVLPFAAFGYWCSSQSRAAFSRFRQLESLRSAVRQGTVTAKDFRFVRLRWEVTAESVGAFLRWAPFAKGGAYSPYHDDVHLVLLWDGGGDQMTAWGAGRVQNVEWFFRCGLTYSRRAKRFAPRVLPAGCAFSDKGPSVFDVDSIGPLPNANDNGTEHQWTDLHQPRLFACLGLLNSNVFMHLLSLGVGVAQTQNTSTAIEVGLLQRMPLPDTVLDDRVLADAALRAYEARREADFYNETTAAFVLPFAAPAPFGAMVAERLRRAADAAVRYATAVDTIDRLSLAHYGFDAAVAAEVARHVGPLHALTVPDEKLFAAQLAKDVLSWALGVALGRFDARLATGARAWPAPGDPFALVTPVSPGMHPPTEPFDKALVDEDGILVDDPSHPDDVVKRVEAVLAHVWGAEAPALVGALTKALKLDAKEGLRQWFTRTPNGGFWEEHRRRYTKSNREAPLYVPLRSPGGRWLVWVSYHRLSKQTLYALLGDRYLLHWRKVISAAIDPLRAQAKLSGADRDRLDELRRDEADLGAFEALLRGLLEWRPEKAGKDVEAVAYEPQHDDGLLVCLSPLHALVPWPPKKKGQAKSRLEEIWRLVEKRELDWSRTAMRYFPAQVTKKCEKELSLAIAHGLDETLPQWKGWRLKVKGGADAASDDEADEDDEDEDEDEDA